MVYSWNCTRCSYTVWAPEGAIRDAVQSHLFDHDRGALYKEGFRVGWNCPDCNASALEHDEEKAIRAFKRHRFEHVTGQLRSDAHVVDAIGGTGNALVLAPPNGAGAADARTHFFEPCDVALLVTANVGDRLRSLDRRLPEWPARTIVVTTSERPLAGVDDVDFRRVPLEIVQLDPGLGLGGIGETISRVIDEHNDDGVTISVAFEILSELLSKCELERLFQFLHLLTARVESADALSHFYCDPNRESGPTINLLSELFDVRISATDERFVQKG